MSDNSNTEDKMQEREAQEVKKGAEEGELPLEVLRKELERARKESASYRTRLREVEEKLGKAKSPEEFEAAVAELAEKNKVLERELMIERIGRDLPDELRSLLKGDTEEELKAHAEQLRKFVPIEKAPPARLAGGLDPRDDGDDFDVQEVARLARLGQL